MWEPILERLAAERDVIAVDLPGFGATPQFMNGTAPTPTALAAVVARFLASLGIERAHVAGNSLGGWVALELARTGHARSVAGLCPAGLWPRPLGPRGGRDIRRIGRASLPFVPALVRSLAGRRALLAGSVAHPERVPPAAAARLVRSYVTAPGFDAANAAMRADVFRGGADIDVPVTLAWAERDRLVGPPRQGAPHWRQAVLRDCGHLPFWDDPEQVAGVVLESSASGR